MAVPTLSKMDLRQFRSFKSAKVDFDNPTLLVGQNGAGKSNFTDALSFLAEAMASPLQAVFDRRGGVGAVGTVFRRSSTKGRAGTLVLIVQLKDLGEETKSADYGIRIKPMGDHGFEISQEICRILMRDGSKNFFKRTNGTFESNVPSLEPALECNALALPLIGGDARFQPVLRFLSEMRVYRIDPLALRNMQDPDSGIRLRPDGSNAASVLREIKQLSPRVFRKACGLLEAIVPQTVEVAPKTQGNKLSLQFTQQWSASKKVKFDAFSMSDGTLRAVGLVAAVFQRPAPSVLVVEEPEATMHPGALGAVLDLVEHASHTMQVVVTTHSPDVLDASWIEGRHLRIVKWRNGATEILPTSDASQRIIKDGVMRAGELLRSNALTAADSM